MPSPWGALIGGLVIHEWACADIRRGIITEIKMVVFPGHSPFRHKICSHQLGYNINSVIKALDGRKLVDLREPLLGGLIIPF